MIAPTVRLAWIARCVWRLKRQYGDGTPLPCGERGRRRSYEAMGQRRAATRSRCVV